MNSYWNQLAERRDVVPAANKCVNRSCLDGVAHDMGTAPALIVIHTMVGTWQSADSRFQNAADAGHASAHYGVCLDGGIKQWVDEKDAAYHAGNFAANMDSIGIEHEDAGDYNGPRTPQLYAASARLVGDIAKRYGIPLTHISRADYEAGRSGVIAHREISDSPTGCPDSLDIDRIIVAASGQGDEVNQDFYAALYRLFITITEGRDPAAPSAASLGLYEDQYWGKHALDVGPVQWSIDLIADAKNRGIAYEETAIVKLQQQVAGLSTATSPVNVPPHTHSGSVTVK